MFASLLYGLQYCSFGKREQRCIDGYYLRLAKRVLKLQFDHHLSYNTAAERLCVVQPSIKLQQERLRWLGHALRSPDTVLEEVLHFIPEGGKRGRGRPKRRLFDTVKADLLAKDINIDTRNQKSFWSELKLRAADRIGWRKEIVITSISGDASMD